MAEHIECQAEPERGRTRNVHRMPRSLVRIVLVVTVAMTMGMGGFFAGYHAMGSQRHDDLEDLERFETLAEVYDLIRTDYVISDDITDEQLIYGAAKGMVEALGDEGHSVFMDPSDVERYEQSRSEGFVGIGVRIDTEAGPPRVTEPMAGSPALAAGILPGDEILSVDGVPWDFLGDIETYLNLIAGEEGTDVVLVLRHLGEDEPFTITITRELISNITVTWAMLPENVLWLRISGFNDGTGEEVKAALRTGKRLGAESVILDLRNNGGGLIREEMIVQGQFMDAGTIGFIGLDADGNEFPYELTEEQGEWRDGPLVVLINEASASAAESVAASLADNGRAVTIGQTTFGTGTSLATYELNDGSLLMLGVELWLTPKGDSIWLEGLDPMIEVENDPEAMQVFPQLFEGNELTDAEFDALEDSQLLFAYGELTQAPGRE